MPQPRGFQNALAVPAIGAPTNIDFYFDFASPYGYFMSAKIDALAACHGRTVTWRPVMLFAVLRALGLPGPLESPVKREYMLADFERSARFLGIGYRLPPKFPIITPYAARAFYLLAAQAPGAAVPFCADGHVQLLAGRPRYCGYRSGCQFGQPSLPYAGLA